jgi:hypothetical protein
MFSYENIICKVSKDLVAFLTQYSPLSGIMHYVTTDYILRLKWKKRSHFLKPHYLIQAFEVSMHIKAKT